ncbi:MAG: hypothetical protein NUV78_01100 [Candidatus Zambryskibacteria bacterium]|nr:hypothetical protein [Candidatus Zambryskibacteria bacterium]
MAEVPLWMEWALFITFVVAFTGIGLIHKWREKPQCPNCGYRRRVLEARTDPDYLGDEHITGFDWVCGNGKCGISFGEATQQQFQSAGLMS